MSNETKGKLNPPCGCIFNINCTLHKTAPDMYEALKRIKSLIASGDWQLPEGFCETEINQIEHAINKAEGKC